MAKEKKLFSGTLLLGASAVFGKVLSLCLLPFFTAKLSPSAFGATEIFISTAVLLAPLFSLYAPQSSFRFLAKGEKGAARAGALLLGVGLVLLAAVIPLLSRFPTLRPYRYLLYFYVCASLLRAFLSQLLRAQGKFGVFALQQSFCALLTALLQVLFLSATELGATGYLLGILLGDATTFLILLLCFFPNFEKGVHPDRALYRKMLRFALPLMPSALLWWGMGAIEKYFLLYYHGEASMGLYAVAGRFPALIGFAAGVFLEVWHYAALQSEGKSEAVLFSHIYALVLPLVIFAGVAVSICAPFLISGALASGYGEAVRAVGLLSTSAVCAGLSSFLDSIYTLRLRSVYSMLTVLFSTVCNFLFSLWLVPRLGIVGAAAAGALSFAMLFLVRLWHTSRMLRFPRHAMRSVLSLILLFSCGVLMAGKHAVFATVMALISLFPMTKLLLDAVHFLFKRSRVFFAHIWKNRRKSSHKSEI